MENLIISTKKKFMEVKTNGYEFKTRIQQLQGL